MNLNKISDKIVFSTLKNIKYGYLEITKHNGELLKFGNPNDQLKANLKIKKTNFTFNLIKGGSVGFAESYMKNEFETKNLSNLNALWVELVFGLKTEILNNLFLGFELQLKSIIKQKNIQNISNLYIPGFNRTYDSSGLGAGFSYTVSYLIPIIKK